MERISLLGATGSIGTSALDVISQYKDRYSVFAVAANTQVDKLAAIAAATNAEVAVIADESKYSELKESLRARGSHAKAMAGAGAVVATACSSEVDTVIGAIVGAAGIASTFAAAKTSKKLLLANKESLVCGGKLLMDLVAKNRATLLPVDSEHNAIFQCLAGSTKKMHEKLRILLTASGGPFRQRQSLDDITVEEATHHPNWSMGKKITVDSSTLMNKGLEVIEARWLFDVPQDRIEVVVHPQSIIHSMVEYEDKVVMAQMGSPDMRNTIAYCLAYPERMDVGVSALDFAKIRHLTFEKPDYERFPLLGLAYEALNRGGCACIQLNAANELAVEAFLNRKIKYTDIAKICEPMMLSASSTAPKNLDDILAADIEARVRTSEFINSLPGE